MINHGERQIIVDLAKQYHVRRVILFGSNARSEGPGQDIDLAVEGLEKHLFFDFYSELIFRLPLPVDLVDLSKENKFNQLIRQEGISLYG